MVSVNTLIKMATFGGFACIGAAVLQSVNTENRTKSSDYYKEALRLVRTHRGAVSLLGEPIRDGNFRMIGTDKIDDRMVVQMNINIKGPKDRGKLHMWISGEAGEKIQSIKIDKLELELNSDSSKRLVIKKQESV